MQGLGKKEQVDEGEASEVEVVEEEEEEEAFEDDVPVDVPPKAALELASHTENNSMKKVVKRLITPKGWDTKVCLGQRNIFSRESCREIEWHIPRPIVHPPIVQQKCNIFSQEHCRTIAWNQIGESLQAQEVASSGRKSEEVVAKAAEEQQAREEEEAVRLKAAQEQQARQEEEAARLKAARVPPQHRLPNDRSPERKKARQSEEPWCKAFCEDQEKCREPERKRPPSEVESESKRPKLDEGLVHDLTLQLHQAYNLLVACGADAEGIKAELWAAIPIVDELDVGSDDDKRQKGSANGTYQDRHPLRAHIPELTPIDPPSAEKTKKILEFQRELRAKYKLHASSGGGPELPDDDMKQTEEAERHLRDLRDVENARAGKPRGRGKGRGRGRGRGRRAASEAAAKTPEQHPAQERKPVALRRCRSKGPMHLKEQQAKEEEEAARLKAAPEQQAKDAEEEEAKLKAAQEQQAKDAEEAARLKAAEEKPEKGVPGSGNDQKALARKKARKAALLFCF